MLEIKNLHVKASSNSILNGIDLSIKPGQIHAIMGPNGSGKSTLAKVLAGHPGYQIIQGQILYDCNFKYEDITQWSPERRVQEGLFMAFQYPVEIPGVSNLDLLKASFQAVCKHQGVPKMKDQDFTQLVREKLQLVGLPFSFVHRSVNDHFSGGEKKRNEILQMAVLSPRLAILDETDSGLDVDSLSLIAKGLKSLFNKDKAFVLITHYNRLLHHIQPHFVHIIQNGKIKKTGDFSLANELEKKGYKNI